jgi:hypothetical protein
VTYTPSTNTNPNSPIRINVPRTGARAATLTH